MERRRREADLIVIGRGLVAIITSALASEAGMRVVHYSIANRHRLPDHDWLHSGLLLDADLPTAQLVRIWGRNMLRTFGIKTSSEPGIFLAHTDEMAGQLERSAARLGVQISELAPVEAARKAGPHFSQSRSYAVPDALFDKGALAAIARQCCVGGGASVVELDPADSIALLPCDAAAGGIRVQTARELAEGAVTVVADGAMIPALIEPLGIGHRLAVNRSSLIAMPGPAGLMAGLLVDLDKGLSYVRHHSDGASPVYTVAHTPSLANLPGAPPAVGLLPFEMWPGRPGPGKRVVAVAGELEIAEVQGNPPVLPWIYGFKREGFPGLVAAISNVANLALWTARQVIKRVSPSRPDQEWGRASASAEIRRQE